VFCQPVDFSLHCTGADRLPLLAAILGSVNRIPVQVRSIPLRSESEVGIVRLDCAHLIPVLPVSGPEQPGIEGTLLNGPPVRAIEETRSAHCSVAGLRISILNLPAPTCIFREQNYSAGHFAGSADNPSGLLVSKMNIKQPEVGLIIHGLPDRLVFRCLAWKRERPRQNAQGNTNASKPHH